MASSESKKFHVGATWNWIRLQHNKVPGMLSFGLKELHLRTAFLAGWQCWKDFQLELDNINILLLCHETVLTVVERKQEII